MSTHPNAMLLCVLTPDDLARKTARAIVGEQDAEEGTWSIQIEARRYTMCVMEDDYDEDNQISAPTGSIVLSSFLTYGYGEVIGIGEVQSAAEALRLWAVDACAKHHCTFHIVLGANYR